MHLYIGLKFSENLHIDRSVYILVKGVFNHFLQNDFLLLKYWTYDKV